MSDTLPTEVTNSDVHNDTANFQKDEEAGDLSESIHCGSCWQMYKDLDAVKIHRQSCKMRDKESYTDCKYPVYDDEDSMDNDDADYSNEDNTEETLSEYEAEDTKENASEAVDNNTGIIQETNQNVTKNKRKVEKKRFVCDECFKSFHKNSLLVMHKQMHNTTKPHICDLCNKAFKWKGSLLVHKKMHEQEKILVCDICNLTFNAKNSLILHKRVHTCENLFRCGMCSASFKQVKLLGVHITAMHSIIYR